MVFLILVPLIALAVFALRWEFYSLPCEIVYARVVDVLPSATLAGTASLMHDLSDEMGTNSVSKINLEFEDGSGSIWVLGFAQEGERVALKVRRGRLTGICFHNL